MLDVITEATPEANDVLRLRYADGAVIRVDFRPVIEQGGVFSALADPAVFVQVSIGEHGRSLEWPGAIDFCADALRLQGVPAGSDRSGGRPEVRTIMSDER
jgi:hypothetical protein